MRKLPKSACGAMHKTIKKATEDMERFRFNTMLAALMEYTNLLKQGSGGREYPLQQTGRKRLRTC